MKDQYYEKAELTQQKYEEVFLKLSEIQKDVVAVDEIKKDRDTRIFQLRDELDQMSKLHEDVSKKHAKVSVQLETASQELE